MKHNIIRSLVFIAIGIYAITLANDCNSFAELNYATRSFYGGDAYTGIQNAAANTSQNVAELAELVKLGFSSLIRIVAFILIGIGAADIIPFILGKLRTITQENE